MQDILPHKTATSLTPPLSRPSLWNRKTVWGLLLLGAVIWALFQTGLFREDLINEGGWSLAVRFLEAALHPDLSPEFLWLTVDATLTTLAFAVSGIFFSLIFGVVGGILASEVWWLSFLSKKHRPGWFHPMRAPWLAIRSVLAVLRAIHEIIWGLFFVNIIGLDPLTAILAIAIPFGAVTAKVFSEILDETPRRPFIVLQNSGVSPLKAFIYTLLPQASLDWLSYGFYRFECSIRAAAVLGIIGAGGLGHQIFLSLQSLKYDQIWTLFLALFLLNGLADFWSGLLRRRLGSRAVFCRGELCAGPDEEGTSSTRPALHRQDQVVRLSLGLAAFLIPFSFWYVSPEPGKLASVRTWHQLIQIGQASFPPNFAALPLSEWLRLSSITLAMSLLAVTGAGLLGLLLSFPAASNFLKPDGLLGLGHGSSRRRYRWTGLTTLFVTRAVLLLSRSIPPPIWALILLFVLFPGIVPGAVALGLYTLGVLGRLMAEVVENLDDRPLTALKGQGAAGAQLFAYGVLPSTLPRFVSYFLYRWEETIRATVVIGLVGAGGLGRQLTEQLSSFDYQGVLTTLIVFVGLIFGADLVSAMVRRGLREA